MKFCDAFIDAMKTRGYTRHAVAQEVAVSDAAVWSVINKNNPSMDVAMRYLKVLGYQVVLAPVGVRLPEGCYALDGGEGND